MDTEFEITESLLPILARLAGDAPLPISPWAQVKPCADLGPSVWESVRQAGLSDGGQALKPPVGQVIGLLREPNRFVRLRLISGSDVMDHIIYECGSQGVKVSLTTVPGGFRVRYPAPLEMLMMGLLEYWGDSNLVSCRLKLEVKPEAALVFCSLVDLHRRAVLAERAAMGKSVDPRPCDVGTIASSIRDDAQDGQWLLAAVRSFSGWEGELAPDRIQEALETLASHQVVQKGPAATGYLLADEGLRLANNFLLISQVLRLEVGAQRNDSSVVRSGSLCLQAGIHDNLYLEKDQDLITLETISSHYMAKMVDLFLTEVLIPQAEEKPAQAADPQPAAAVGGERAYFLSRAGQSYGPYTWEELKGFTKTGNIQPIDLVWGPSSKEWVQAGSMSGLIN